MHAGNIFAALMAWLIAKSQGGEIVLRIEDLDRARSKRCYIDQVQNDFELLGLTWDRGPFYQHDRDGAYEVAYEMLKEARLVYPCFCTRADLHAASAPHRGEKLVYPGTCRFLSEFERGRKTRELLSAGDPTRIAPAMRLCVDDRVVSIDDVLQGRYEQRLDRDCGDFLVRRTDGAFAYQLAVVVDDAAQGVNSVVRGIDLLCSSPQQAYLQDLLGLPRVHYAHVPLFVDESGRRLSKRSKSAALDELLSRFGSPAGVIGHIAFTAGLIECDEPAMPDELLDAFSITAARSLLEGRIGIPFS